MLLTVMDTIPLLAMLPDLEIPVPGPDEEDEETDDDLFDDDDDMN